MSGKFTGVTFAKQKVTPSDDAIIRRAILPDGILTGCELSYSGSTLTMAAGHLMICGRQIRMPSVQNWAIVDSTSGFARLVLTIDLTRTATKETFDQVVDLIEYASAEDGFVALDQTDINLSGTRYQIAVCVVSLGTGGITGIVSQLGKSAIDGSGALNFNVVGGLTQPAGPKENTIWVNTDQKITSWIFSAEAPAKPEEGIVWVTTGASSQVAFNALKKNTVMVYPISAKQYVSGAWVDVTVKSYHDGKWVDWIVYLYNSGDECISVTGGWTAYKGGSSSSMTKNNDSITLKGSSENSITAMTSQKIDLTNFNKIEISVIDVKKSGTWNAKLRATEERKNAPTAVAELALAFETGTQYLDVSSLTGSYYIALYLYGGNGMVLTFDKIRLE